MRNSSTTSEVLCRLGLAAFALIAALMQGGAAGAMEMKARPQIAASVAFDATGRLWRARMLGGMLVVDRSDDRGASFTAPHNVTQQAEPVAAEGELLPDIAVIGDRVYVAWTSPLPTPYAGNVRFARSLDGGKTFAAPLTVNDNRDAITHRFQTMHVAPDGRITLVWIDKREGEQAKRAGKPYRGAALYFAVSDDGGASFKPNERFAAHSCECCRIALAGDSDGRPVALWRHVFADGSRDHALARVAPLPDGAEAMRATDDHWQINACPHHGPALAVAADGTRHGVWFSQVAGEPGLFYRSWSQEGKPLAPAWRIGDASASHPAVISLDGRLLIAWKAFDGDKTVVDVIESRDAGRHWSEPRAVAATVDASDHPQLVAYGGEAWLSWSTETEGYRLILLQEDKAAHR